MCGDGRGWEMGGCLGGESLCFVQVELGTRLIESGEAGRGLGRGHTASLWVLPAFK